MNFKISPVCAANFPLDILYTILSLHMLDPMNNLICWKVMGKVGLQIKILIYQAPLPVTHDKEIPSHPQQFGYHMIFHLTTPSR